MIVYTPAARPIARAPGRGIADREKSGDCEPHVLTNVMRTPKATRNPTTMEHVDSKDLEELAIDEVYAKPDSPPQGLSDAEAQQHFVATLGKHLHSHTR